MKSKNKQINNNNKNTKRNYQRSEEAKETGQLNEIRCLRLDPETKQDPSGKNW